MSRDPYRSSAGDLGRSDRWDRDRFYSERDRDRYSEVREEDDRVYTRPAPPLRGPERRPPPPRTFEDDDYVRDRRFYRDDEPRYPRHSPPSSDVGRRVVVDRERTYARSPSPPPRRPAMMLRRQSSLDTFDRRPRGYPEREEYGPPARREDFRAPPYVPIPLPRTKALPPPRHVEREYYDDIRVSDPGHYGDEEFRPYPERVREKEVVRTRRRNRSRESRTTRSHARSSSRSSSLSSSSASTGGGTSVKSEYPKKGKTRIPARLVSKRAILDLGYQFVEEGHTIVVQKALGQDNIDDLLKLSEDYKKTDLELAAPLVDEVLEERRHDIFAPPPPPVAHTHAPVIIPARSPAQVEVVDTTVLRAISPARTSRSSRSHSMSSSRAPVIVDARPREISDEIAVGPLALVESSHHHHHHRRHGSGSMSGRLIRSEIRDLERELARRDRRDGRELVHAERLPSGELVVYQEEVEKVEQPSRGTRIEKDKKGPPPQLMRAMLATLT